jgi:hypothetical protein
MRLDIAVPTANVVAVPDVFDRVDAMPVIFKMLPAEALDGSGFAVDAAVVSFKTYDVVRTRLQDGVTGLLVAARMARDPKTSLLGTHLLALRGSLVATAKGCWLIQPNESTARVARAVGLICADRQQGYDAMHAAAELGEMPAAQGIAGRFAEARQSLEAEADRLGVTPERPPRDGTLIADLGGEIDDYYGTHGPASGRRDARLLWNASSSLAHGERWFRDLTSGSEAAAQRRQLAELITHRSLDIVCSGLSLLGLRILFLATAPFNPTWLKLVHTCRTTDAVEVVMQVVGSAVDGRNGACLGLDINGALATGGTDECLQLNLSERARMRSRFRRDLCHDAYATRGQASLPRLK